MTVPTTKAPWRELILAARRARPDPDRRRAQESISSHLLAALRARATTSPATVCLYLPLPSEPLAPDLPAVLLRAGYRVLAPVARPGAPLDWCAIHLGAGGDLPLARGGHGVPEPIGPPLGAAAIRVADLILVPALAVDRKGFRLGRGGGFYDRSLALLPSEHHASTCAVVFDGELVDELPHDEHDIPVTHAVTPAGGIAALRPPASQRPLPARFLDRPAISQPGTGP